MTPCIWLTELIWKQNQYIHVHKSEDLLIRGPYNLLTKRPHKRMKCIDVCMHIRWTVTMNNRSYSNEPSTRLTQAIDHMAFIDNLVTLFMMTSSHAMGIDSRWSTLNFYDDLLSRLTQIVVFVFQLYSQISVCLFFTEFTWTHFIFGTSLQKYLPFQYRTKR